MGRSLDDTWLVPDAVTPETLEQRLATAYRVERCPDYGADVTYVDSFDWRLYQAGMLLHNHGHAWTLYEVDGKLSLLRSGPLCRKKCLLDSFPEGDLRNALARVLGVRALLPLAQVGLSGCQLRLYNAGNELLARLVFEVQHIAATDEILRLIRIFPIKGHEAERETMRQVFRNIGITRPISQLAGFEAGCRAVGRVPLDYSSKFPRALAHDMERLRSVDAVRRICLHLLSVMRCNIPGVIEDWDSVFLHDFRVALRRTRTAVAMGKEVFSTDALAPFKAGFAELGRITGPTRDMDAFLRSETKWLERAKPAARAGLQAGFAELAKERTRARRALVRRLKGEKLARLFQDWERFLGDTGQSLGPLAEKPTRKLADKILRKHIRKVLADGRTLAALDIVPDVELHQLRVVCKKLRYSLEFFRDIYPEDAASSTLYSLKSLQSILGRMHDLSVQMQLVEHCASRIGSADSAKENGKEAIAALENLAMELREKKTPLGEEFARAFAELDERLVNLSGLM